MQNEPLEVRRTAEGAIDVGHYAHEAATERRQARSRMMQTLMRGAKRGIAAIVAFVAFWNISLPGYGVRVR